MPLSLCLLSLCPNQFVLYLSPLAYLGYLQGVDGWGEEEAKGRGEIFKGLRFPISGMLWYHTSHPCVVCNLGGGVNRDPSEGVS